VAAVLFAATAEEFAGTSLWVYILMGEIISACFLFWLWMKFFFKSSLGKRFVIGDSPEGIQEAQAYEHRYRSLVGCSGQAMTPLRPSGTARIEGKRYDVVTEGSHIAREADISVVKVEGSRIVVRAQSSGSEPEASQKS